MTIEQYKILSEDSTLRIIGDVKTVLTGSVKEELMNNSVLEKIKYGLGAASFSDCSCVGESIILNQNGYTCYVNINNELTTAKGSDALGSNEFRSPFLMGLQPGAHPSALIQIQDEVGITLDNLFAELGVQYPTFAFVMYALFKKLDGTYLKVPPIFNENINTHIEKYWAKAEELPLCVAYAFGVVITEAGKQIVSDKNLNRAFYENPQEKNKGKILSHTHAVLVEEPNLSDSNNVSDIFSDKNNTFYEMPEIDSPLGVRHVLTTSVVSRGLLALYKINEIKLL